MVSSWKLPYSLNIGGVDYEIRTDYETVLDLLIALNDPEFKSESKENYAYIQIVLTLKILFPNYKEIPKEHIEEAIEKANAFIDMGNVVEEKNKIKIMDWEKDANILIPPLNKVLGYEVRNPNIKTHWWTFLGAYMEIGESLFSNVIHIRNKKARGKKLEKWEQEFYKENKSLIEFEQKTKRSKEEKKALDDYFYGYKRNK